MNRVAMYAITDEIWGTLHKVRGKAVMDAMNGFSFEVGSIDWTYGRQDWAIGRKILSADVYNSVKDRVMEPTRLLARQVSLAIHRHVMEVGL